MQDLKNLHRIETDILLEEASKMQMVKVKRRCKNNSCWKITQEKLKLKWRVRQWTNTKRVWNNSWQGMNRSKNNNWCRDKIFSISWGKIYSVMKTGLSMVILFAMHFGAFGPLIMKDMSMQKWKTSWLYLRKRLNKDLNPEISPKALQCQDLGQVSIQNWTKNITWLSNKT